MLDYKDIITKHYALGMSGRKIAESLKVSKSGVNDFLRAFQECPELSYPLPEGITNYGIAAPVYGKRAVEHSRDLSYEMPDYETVEKEMSSRKNMPLVVLWNRYSKQCRDQGVKFYSYRQFCENYAKWCEENKEPQWIAVNNNALQYFGGVPALVVCDNCKQAVIANKDWIDPELNRD